LSEIENIAFSDTQINSEIYFTNVITLIPVSSRCNFRTDSSSLNFIHLRNHYKSYKL